MSSKALLVTVGVVLVLLTVIGLGIGADMRLVASDALGAIVAGSLALLIDRGGKLASVQPAIVAVTVLVMAILAVTSRASHWMVALTVAAAFAFGFVALTTRSRRGADEGGGSAHGGGPARRV